MKKFKLSDLGITDADILRADVIELDNGEADFIWEFSDEAQSILDAFCHREKINLPELLKAMLLSDGEIFLDDLG